MNPKPEDRIIKKTLSEGTEKRNMNPPLPPGSPRPPRPGGSGPQDFTKPDLNLGTAREGKYGRISSEKKQFHPDEPVFLIRATDRMAIVVLDAYRDEAIRNHLPQTFVNGITAAVLRVMEWQRAHPELVKTPD